MTPKQTEFLLLIAKTGFLTNKHLEQAGLSKINHSNHRTTKDLLLNGFIGRIMVASGFGIGRKVVYFLTKKGADFIADMHGIPLEEIAYNPVKGGIHRNETGEEMAVIRTDFSHKEAYITAFIAFYQYIQCTDYVITKYKHYYQRTGDKGTTLKLGHKNFRPDGIWFMESLDQTAPKYVLVVEVHRHSDRKHIIRQLLQQVEALKQRSVQNRFGFNHPYLVLSVFCDENIKVMQGVLEELKQMPEWEYFKNYFFFSRLEDLKANFYDGLGYFGKIAKPFPKKI